jgi:hypothetical protein
MRTRRPPPIAALPIAWLALLLAPPVARPLPLFSRALGVACSTCHDVVPRLNRVGIAFAQRGHLLGAHDPEPGSRSRLAALSAVGSAGITGEDERSRVTSSSLELVAAGAPAERLSYHLDAGVDHTGLDVRRGDDFVQWSDAARAGTVALKAGRFAAELPFLSPERRLTLARYLSPLAFTARGFELDGARADWTAAAGLSLSDRTRAGGANPHAVRAPLEDTFLRLGRDFGAQSVGAQMLFDREDSELSTLSWLQHLRVQLAASLSRPGVTVIPSYVFDRFDDRPAPGVHERHQYFALESIVPLWASRWLVTGRYEHDYRTRNTYDPEAHRQQAVLQLAWQPRPNARLAMECAGEDDRLAHQRRADVDAFAQAYW